MQYASRLVTSTQTQIQTSGSYRAFSTPARVTGFQHIAKKGGREKEEERGEAGEARAKIKGEEK